MVIVVVVKVIKSVKHVCKVVKLSLKFSVSLQQHLKLLPRHPSLGFVSLDPSQIGGSEHFELDHSKPGFVAGTGLQLRLNLVLAHLSHHQVSHHHFLSLNSITSLFIQPLLQRLLAKHNIRVLHQVNNFSLKIFP